MQFDIQPPAISTQYTKGDSSINVTVTDGISGVKEVKYKVGTANESK